MEEVIKSEAIRPCSQGKKQVCTSSTAALEPMGIHPTRTACSVYWQRLRDTTTFIRHGTPKGWEPWAKFRRFLAFLGPGAVISVAYVDPDNYQTAVSSGASFE